VFEFGISFDIDSPLVHHFVRTLAFGIWIQKMGFFNSLTVRIPLAVIGGILYGLLTYEIFFALDLSQQTATAAGLLVFFLYLGSRLLILFSGIDTPYYSKERRDSPSNNTAFYQTAQWVGKFYHYHDAVLFAFLVILAIIFVISLIMDGLGNRPFGQTIQDLWNKLTLSF
jgi:hypothetical protein